MRRRFRAFALRLRQRPGDVAGGLGGAAIGTALGQPLAGAAAGQIITRTLQASHDGFFARRLAPDERRRAEYVFGEARRERWLRMASGEQPAEWVRTAAAGERLGSVEVLEHGLQKARDEFEERKLRHLAALLAYVFYEEQFSPADAHRFLELGGRLSYRQLLLLSIFAEDEIRAELPDHLLSPGMSWSMMGLLLEIQELAIERAIATNGHMVSSYHEVNLAQTKSLGLGSVLHAGMRLKEVDMQARAAALRTSSSGSACLPAAGPDSTARRSAHARHA